MSNLPSSGTIAIPLGMALSNPRLFWALAEAYASSGMMEHFEDLIQTDWSEISDDALGAQLAEPLVAKFLAVDDLPRLQMIVEAFSPSKNKHFFAALRASAFKNPASKNCMSWFSGQGLVEKGLVGFKQALFGGNLELAKTLYAPSADEAESVFYEKPEAVSKDSIAYLAFANPGICSFKSVVHAMERKAHEETILYLMWKMESEMDKADLRYPDGNEESGKTILTIAVSKGYPAVVKKMVEWNHALVHDKLSPKEITPLWPEDKTPILLDGSLGVTVGDWAVLYLHESLCNGLFKCSAPMPNIAKVKTLVPALGRILESRRPGESERWIYDRISRCEKMSSRIWG